MAKVVTVVLKRDGSLHVASDKISLADAERWAEEGHSVFLIATQGRRWAVNQLPSGKIFTDETAVTSTGDPATGGLLLEFKGEKE